MTGALLVAPADAASADVPDTTLTDLTVPVVAPGKRAAAPSAERGPARSVVAVLPACDTVPYSTVGVTWTTASSPPQVQVRVKQQGWGQWQLLDNDEESGGAREGTAPVYVGESTGVEVRLLADPGASAPKDVRVSLIDSPVVAADAHPHIMPGIQARSTSISGMAPQPSIVSRKGWGADESWRNINKGCATPRIDQTIKAAIVHHTAGSNNYSAAQSASIVRGIYAFQVKSRGWCDVGYNFLVDRYGTIFEGRAGGIRLPVHGAHATEWNTNIVGVSFMGDFQAATPPAGMLESGAKLIAWKLDGNYRNPLGRVTLAGKSINVISGHGDVLLTSCPGRNIRSRLGSFRSNVAAKVGSIRTPIQQRWLALGGDTGAAGSPHEPETTVASGRLTRFTTYDIAWSSSTGAKFVKGAIRNRYRALGGPARRLGFPTTDELRGAAAGSYESVFARGRLQWTRATGTRAIVGGINNAHGRLSVSQRRSLGPAKTDETKVGVAGSYRQLFTGGGIWWGRTTSGRAVLGPIATRYLAAGAETGRLGLPDHRAGRRLAPGHLQVGPDTVGIEHRLAAGRRRHRLDLGLATGIGSDRTRVAQGGRIAFVHLARVVTAIHRERDLVGLRDERAFGTGRDPRSLRGAGRRYLLPRASHGGGDGRQWRPAAPDLPGRNSDGIGDGCGQCNARLTPGTDTREGARRHTAYGLRAGEGLARGDHFLPLAEWRGVRPLTRCGARKGLP